MPELEALRNLHFIRPWWLAAIPLLLLCMYYLKRQQDPIDKWAPIISPHLAQAMLVRGGRSHWFNPITVGTVLILLGIIALSGPSWKRQPSPFVQDTAALVVIQDLSGTMKQKDIQPSRFERAKQKIEDLLELRQGSPTGLIVYAGSAHSVIPLTNDPDIIRNFLASVVPQMMPRAGKSAEKALAIADDMLSDSPAGTILLVTDGDNPQTEAAFAEYFAGNEHQLLVLGVGLEAGAEGIDDNIIPLQSASLERLASASDGHYQQVTLESTDVERINRRINNHLLSVADSERPWVDFGYYLTFPLALVFLLWFRKGWTLQWCLIAVLTVGIGASPRLEASEAPFMDLWLTPDQQGRFYFEREDYKTAAQRFEDTAWRGVALYMDENFIAAADTFAQIDSIEGLFNLGNAWAQSENYVYAVRTYNRLLEQQPDHAGALKNRAIVQAIIDEINLLSESQQSEGGDTSQELGDEPLRAEGAEKEEFGQQEVQQLSADDILNNEAIREQWMRQIQQDPSVFLSLKFLMQLEREDSGESP
jgi:Ca-activated chloride channel family protein